jgi:hypothetical protein
MSGCLAARNNQFPDFLKRERKAQSSEFLDHYRVSDRRQTTNSRISGKRTDFLVDAKQRFQTFWNEQRGSVGGKTINSKTSRAVTQFLCDQKQQFQNFWTNTEFLQLPISQFQNFWDVHNIFV